MTTQPNNEIMSRLLADQDTNIPENTNDAEPTSIASARVLSTRYKVYLVIILLIIYAILMYIFLPALDRQQAEQSQLQNIVNQLQSFESKRLQYVADAWFMDKLQEQEEILLNCFNNETGCDALDPVLQERKELARFLLLFNNVQDPIMGLNEKRILASLNDYALMYNPNNTANRERNGAIHSVRIADPVEYEANVMRVPINLTVQFSNKDGLLSFIDNIENTLPANIDHRLLYVIDQIDYDVVKYNQLQEANIHLSLFYYQK